MWTLWGFFCLGCLLVSAFQTTKKMLSPEWRQKRKEDARLKEEVARVRKETAELLGRKVPE